MKDRGNEKRISLSITLPSVGMMLFIEKALQDDKFFESAIENPLGVLKENGVRLNVESLTPKNLATFFGALAGAKELIKKKEIKDIKFENVFGKAAEVRGSSIVAETNRGMWTQFTKDALIEKEMFLTVEVNFKTLQESFRNVFTEINKDIRVDSRIDIKTSGSADVEVDHLLNFAVESRVSFSGKTESYKGTDTGTTFHFDADKGIGSQTSSSIDTYKTQNFSGFGKFDEVSYIEQIMNGPLINPADLANIAAQINTYVNIAEQM